MPSGRLVRIAPARKVGAVRYAKKKRTYKKLASRISSIMSGRELKELTAVPHNTWTNLTQTGDTNRCLNQIAAGDDFNQRSGRQIEPTSLTILINMRGAYRGTPIAGNEFFAPVPYRILVVQDRGGSGTPPPLSQILENSSVVAGEHNNYISGYNDDYVRVGKSTKNNPLKVLADKKGYLTPTGFYFPAASPVNAVGSGQGKRIIIRIPKKKMMKCQYSGTAATDQKAGSIWFYAFTGTSSVANENNQLVMRHTLRYYDD